jgi:hypothetical protein
VFCCGASLRSRLQVDNIALELESNAPPFWPGSDVLFSFPRKVCVHKIGPYPCPWYCGVLDLKARNTSEYLSFTSQCNRIEATVRRVASCAPNRPLLTTVAYESPYSAPPRLANSYLLVCQGNGSIPPSPDGISSIEPWCFLVF